MPGAVLTVAVLDFLGAGLVLIVVIFLAAMGGSIVGDTQPIFVPLLGLLLLFGVLYLVLGIFLLKGHGWARIVQTILAGLTLAGSLMSLASERVTGGVLLNVAIPIVMIVLLFTRDASEFFAGSRKPSRSRY